MEPAEKRGVELGTTIICFVIILLTQGRLAKDALFLYHFPL